jgi:hypothetical protein
VVALSRAASGASPSQPANADPFLFPQKGTEMARCAHLRRTHVRVRGEDLWANFTEPERHFFLLSSCSHSLIEGSRGSHFRVIGVCDSFRAAVLF